MLSSARAISYTVQPSHLLCEETDVFMNLKIKGIMGHVQCIFLEFFWLGFYPRSSRRCKESKREETNVTAQSTAFIGVRASIPLLGPENVWKLGYNAS